MEKLTGNTYECCLERKGRGVDAVYGKEGSKLGREEAKDIETYWRSL